MKYLLESEILYFHYKVINDYGGSHGVRDQNRLKALVAAPKQEVFGEIQYKTVHYKAAVYLRNIISDHLFVDGNKRTPLLCTGIFLKRNGYVLACQQKGLEEYIVLVATQKPSIEEIATWLKEHTK